MGMIERGRIVESAEAGYTVKSYDRDGIITPPIPAMNSETYRVGDAVFYLLFSDGTGRILGILDEAM